MLCHGKLQGAVLETNAAMHVDLDGRMLQPCFGCVFVHGVWFWGTNIGTWVWQTRLLRGWRPSGRRVLGDEYRNSGLVNKAPQGMAAISSPILVSLCCSLRLGLWGGWGCCRLREFAEAWRPPIPLQHHDLCMTYSHCIFDKSKRCFLSLWWSGTMCEQCANLGEYYLFCLVAQRVLHREPAC